MTPHHPFTGLRVVELSSDSGGELVGKLFADMGADVTKVEAPGGSASRKVGPFANGDVHPNASLNFWFYNGNKSSVVLDPTETKDWPAIDALLENADFLISSFQPANLKAAGLDFDAIGARFPKLIIVSVTPFGLTGPWADYKVSDLVALAAGGLLLLCGYDDHEIPPIKPGGDQAYHTAASFAFTGALLALIDRQKTGTGQLVDVSMHESTAVCIEMAFCFWAYQRALVARQTCRHASPALTQPSLIPCADGRYLFFAHRVADPKAWNALVDWLDSHGMAADLIDPAYQDMAHRQENLFHIQDIVECFCLTVDADEAFESGQVRGMPLGILNSPEDLLANEHLKAREFFIETEEDIGPVTYPGAPYRFSAFGPVPRRPAPKLEGVTK